MGGPGLPCAAAIVQRAWDTCARSAALGMPGGLPGAQGPPASSIPRRALQGDSAMAEKMSPSPGGGITPLQQMLASGTGAILTSLFGEYAGVGSGAGGCHRGWHG